MARRQEATAQAVEPEGTPIDLARERLIRAVANARGGAIRHAPAYAEIVNAVVACRRAGMKARTIAEVIATGWRDPGDRSPVNRGIAARYIRMARWEVGEYLKTEVAPTAVLVAGREFTSPVTALRSSTSTFSAVYLAWRAAVTPSGDAAPAEPKTLREAAESFVNKAAVTYQDAEGKRLRLKIATDGRTWALVVRDLIRLPVAQQNLPSRAVQDIMRSTGKLLETLNT